MAALNAPGWAGHFDTLARYNAWATQRLLQATEALPDADYRRDLGPQLGQPWSALDLVYFLQQEAAA